MRTYIDVSYEERAGETAMKKLTILIAAIFLFCLPLTLAAEAKTEQVNSKFIYASGDKLLDSQNEEFVIKGISFGNNVWSEPALPGTTHHTEASYKEIAELGFNSVRFYLNYHLFEDDSSPYVYKQSGFDWLDQNIKWAKKYNIKLILNMHVPQGGFQSQGNGTELWTETSNLKRLRALWKAIAKKYRNEPVVIGYGLINEPVLPLLDTTQQSMAMYSNYIKSLVKTIRTVDKNHIIFVENVLMLKNLETGEFVYSAPGENSHFLIDDENIVYEFHDYSPSSFTHQDTDWAGTKGQTKSYPSGEIISYDSDHAWLGCQPADKTAKTKNGWVYYESQPVTKTEDYNMGRISCQVFNSGKSGTVYFDEIKVIEYDKQGNATEIILVDAEEQSEFWFWSNNNSGSYGLSDTVGFSDQNSLYIKGSTDDANFSGKAFELKDGCSYVISAWVKRENCRKAAVTAPRIDFVKGTNILSFDKAYLESNLLKHISFAKKNNVPVYLGEFGVVSNAFVNDRGALQYVRDLIELCEKHEIHFNYHTYHEVSFGLYMNSDYELPGKLNTKLAALFREIL